MKAVILAGGVGSRLSEETGLRPKPMVEVGGKPILWHIMNIYSCYGVDEFVIALGYRGEVIKEYFLNFYALNNDITLDLATGATSIHDGRQPRWKVHLVDTGPTTQTGEGWINGGFFVLNRGVLRYVEGDQTLWERDPMERLAADGELMAFRHEGFWQPMDTIRERKLLEDLWSSGAAPWKIWS